MNFSETFQNNKWALSRAWMDFMIDQGGQALVTWNFAKTTDKVGLRYAEESIHHWHARVDRTLYGPNFRIRERKLRTSFLGFCEHQETNLHFHGVLATPNIKLFERIAPSIWRDVVPGGQFHIANAAATYADRVNWCSYLIKESMITDNMDHVFFSNSKEMK